MGRQVSRSRDEHGLRSGAGVLYPVESSPACRKPMVGCRLGAGWSNDEPTMPSDWMSSVEASTSDKEQRLSHRLTLRALGSHCSLTKPSGCSIVLVSDRQEPKRAVWSLPSFAALSVQGISSWVTSVGVSSPSEAGSGKQATHALSYPVRFGNCLPGTLQGILSCSL